MHSYVDFLLNVTFRTYYCYSTYSSIFGILNNCTVFSAAILDFGSYFEFFIWSKWYNILVKLSTSQNVVH